MALSKGRGKRRLLRGGGIGGSTSESPAVVARSTSAETHITW